jgi:hypothetical protein
MIRIVVKIILSFSIAWLVVNWWSHLGAQQTGHEAFRIEISQPQYGQKGKTWTCTTAQLSGSECKMAVPLKLDGQAKFANIKVHIDFKTNQVELYASLNGRWYRAAIEEEHQARGRKRPGEKPLSLRDGSLAQQVRLNYWTDSRNTMVINPLFGPSPPELLAVIIQSITQ